VQELNFPKFSYRLKNTENNISIFDVIRKKYVVLQPEEWVRQHCLHFLMEVKNYPRSLINVEKELKINSLKKRYDIVVYNQTGNIELLVECKSPQIVINQDTFDQIARYNMVLQANYLMVTNGIDHFYCQMDYINKGYVFLRDLPQY
jgi:hypothetical protein